VDCTTGGKPGLRYTAPGFAGGANDLIVSIVFIDVESVVSDFDNLS